jgi:hypothetical protein
MDVNYVVHRKRPVYDSCRIEFIETLNAIASKVVYLLVR